MKPLRITIAGLLGLVLLVALGLAALRSPSDLSTSAVFTLTLGALGLALFGARFGRGPSRTTLAGFALGAGGYLLLSLGPWCETEVGPRLLTTRILDDLHLRSTPVPKVGQKVRILWGSSLWSATILEMNADQFKVHYDGFASQDDEWVGRGRIFDADQDSGGVHVLGGPPRPTAIAVASPPFAGAYGNFLRTGHSLFAIACGVVGAVLARAFAGAPDGDVKAQ